jgi:hypothetical protein
MKQSPKSDRLDKILRSSKIVADGFLGNDERPLQEIIDTDLAQVQKLGSTIEEVVGRMRYLTGAAKPMLGNPVEVEGLIVSYEDFKGMIVCPWPHAGRFAKAITTVRCKGSDRCIRWTDLNVHMIAEHGFFEGKGSEFRIEPEALLRIIFPE